MACVYWICTKCDELYHYSEICHIRREANEPCPKCEADALLCEWDEENDHHND